MSKAKTVPEVIRAMIRLFEKRGTWIQGPTAATKDGRHVNPSDPEARKWCMCGSLHKFGLSDELVAQARVVLNDEAQARCFVHYIDYNEAPGRTKRQVLDFLRAALKRAVAASK